ncbi:hypothetical protein VFPPC_16060 [Pochonia chlamydosporia 170]|uniref:Uncharacterized protein n=1 Tax=Pochonia chlamydosporia 170 TaxID=1380566 RepID=A0A179FM83_METCM|nr:hypothetical protein VFPPC_16060 [Pochonia chlamydosporia 170]OAQ66745.1 hypothetical protein VFPPC_16060 [Pochonia chlamydosporia 170]
MCQEDSWRLAKHHVESIAGSMDLIGLAVSTSTVYTVPEFVPDCKPLHEVSVFASEAGRGVLAQDHPCHLTDLDATVNRGCIILDAASTALGKVIGRESSQRMQLVLELHGSCCRRILPWIIKRC